MDEVVTQKNQSEISLTPDGSVRVITVGPVSAEVATHLNHMLREWWASGQTFVVAADGVVDG